MTLRGHGALFWRVAAISVVVEFTKPKRQARKPGTLILVAPSVAVLLLWMIVPLVMTLWFSFQYYNLLNPAGAGFAGIDNYRFLITDPDFWASLGNTLILLGSVLAITVVFGTLLAVLYDQPFPGRNIARLLVVAPFFVMPTVSALIWKNLMMHPIYGVLGFLARSVGLEPVDWFAEYPMASVILILSWEWLPFALLILLTAVQSLDHEQREAARMDGAGPIAQFFHITLPHLGRAISVVVMIETIFLLTVFAEIFVTTSGGPGNATTNLAFLIYARALIQFDVGGASAGGVIAILLANIVAFFLVRTIARRLEV
ncbi:MAG: sugar transporter permease [Rhodospirillales bacterium]|nr:sugar transporter permease [Rhodospirillales bacterium]